MVREITPPTGNRLLPWLKRYDKKPLLLPVWPDSDHLAVVGYRPETDKVREQALLYETEEELAKLSCYTDLYLFFIVPTTIK